MMKNNHSRLITLVLALALVLTLVPLLPAGSPAQAENNLGITTADKVNLRVSASPKAKFIEMLPVNYVCTVLSETDAEGYHWFRVKAKSAEAGNDREYDGYIRGDCFRRLTDEEAAQYSAGSFTATNNPVVNQNTSVADGSTGIVTNSGTNLREGASIHTRSLMKLNRGDVVTILEQPSVISSDTFYKVNYKGTEGFIMSTFVQAGGVPIITPTPTNPGGNTPDPSGVVGYVQTIVGGVNLRATMGGTVIRQLGKGETYPYLLNPTQKGGYTWYFVQAGNNRGYLRHDVVKVVGGGGGGNTPTPVPTGGLILGYVKTTAGGVNLRKNAGYSEPIGRVDKNVVMPYYATSVVKDVTWYSVMHSTLGAGWLHGDFLMLCDANGNPVAGPTPDPGSVTPVPHQQEATYNTLRVGSTGNAVLNLTTELKNQGYFKGTPTRNYTAAVAAAVRNFQSAKGITVDGVAGAATQHKLFGTVPVGAGDQSNLEITLYPAEKIDWYTGGINEMWKRGDNYKVYDVKTGIVWWAHRWAGGYHVDAEPLTAADTARLCKSYGVTTAQEIVDKNLYQRRPLLVTIGTRTFACSLYGVPHNYPEGDTIANNEFKGQLCIHFTNSKTHNGKTVDTGHQEAIEYAYNNCPAGKKE